MKKELEEITRRVKGLTPDRLKALEPKKKEALPFAIAQKDAKRYVPPGSHVWRSLTRNQWCGHVKPLPRVCCLWAKHGGEAPALRECLARMWKNYLMLEGLDYVHCPWTDLLDPAVEQ